MIYLDHAATSYPKPAGVGERMKYYVDQVGANAGRASYGSGCAGCSRFPTWTM